VVEADFRFRLAACGVFCEADNGAWLGQPDHEDRAGCRLAGDAELSLAVG
jgi:hypothetical protein